MLYDIQLIVQASLYLLIFVLNFIVCIPIGVTVVEFGGGCVLYNDITWDNATLFNNHMSSAATCRFPIYVAVSGIFYSLTMAIYIMYVVCRYKDPNIGFQMWTLLLIVLTTKIVVVMLAVSCILSVGLKYTCDRFMKGLEKNANIHQCSDIESSQWTVPVNSLLRDGLRHCYRYPKVSEVASWITFLAWLIQACLYVLRFVRYRRLVLKDRSPGPAQPSGGGQDNSSSDMSNFASIPPTA